MREPLASNHRNFRTAWQLSLMVVGMFGFGFALVPLYDLLCEVTGLGGRTGGAYAYEAASIRPDKSRLISVNFTTNTNAGMPWEFWAEKGGMRVHPGELVRWPRWNVHVEILGDALRLAKSRPASVCWLL